MNPAVLLLAIGLFVTSVSSAFAESRQVFAACIDKKTEDAQALRISPALFNQSFEKSCKTEELLLVNELSVKTLTDLPEIKGLNARARKRSEQYVSTDALSSKNFMQTGMLCRVENYLPPVNSTLLLISLELQSVK